MPTLNIQGQRIKVSDDFLKLSPEDQNATVDEIAGQMGIKAAPEVGQGEAGLRGFKQGATFGWGDEIQGALNMTPGEAWDAMFGSGKAKEAAQQKYAAQRDRMRQRDTAASDQNPWTYGAGNVAGGVLATAPLAPAMGGVGVTAGLARGAASGAGIGAVQGAGDAETMADIPGAAASGAAIGAAIGGPLGAIGGGLASKAANAAAPASNAVVDAGNAVGVTVPRFLSTDSKAVQAAAQAGRQSPIGGPRIEQAAQDYIKDVGEAATKTAQGIGTADPLLAGEAASAGLTRAIMKDLPAQTGALYRKVDQLINPAAKTTLDDTMQLAQKIATERQAAGLSGYGGAVNHVLDAATRPDGLTYAGVKKLRTSVGEMLDKPGILPSDIAESELKQIYKSLTTDLTRTVENAGNKTAAQAWKRANQFAAAASNRKETLAKIVGADGANRGELVFSKLAQMAGPGASGDIRTLNLARRSMAPGEWNDVVSGVVQRLGRTADGQGFSADKFVTEWSKLTPAGKATLFGNNATLQKQLDALVTLSQRSKDATKFANHSGTGRTMLGAGWITGLMANPIATIAGAIGAEAAGRILAKPATAGAAARWAQTMQKASQAGASGTVMAQRATAQFSATLAREFGMPQAANDIGSKLIGNMSRSVAAPQEDGQED